MLDVRVKLIPGLHQPTFSQVSWSASMAHGTKYHFTIKLPLTFKLDWNSLLTKILMIITTKLCMHHANYAVMECTKFLVAVNKKIGLLDVDNY